MRGVILAGGNGVDICRRIQPSARGEYEISDVNAYYARNRDLDYVIMEDYLDTGTYESLAVATELVRSCSP